MCEHAGHLRGHNHCCGSAGRVCDPVFQSGCSRSGENIGLKELWMFVALISRARFGIAAQLVVQD